MRIACLGGGPAGLYFAIAMKRRDRATRSSSSSAIGRTTRSAGAWCCRTRRSSISTPAIPRAPTPSGAPFVYWDDIAVFYRGTRDALVGPRLLRHRPQASAQHSAGSRARARRHAAVRHRVRERRRLPRLRSGGRGRRRELEDSQRAGRRLQAGHRRARLQVHLARHAASGSRTRSPSSSRRPSTAGSGRMPTSSTPIPRPSSSNARMRRGAGLGFDVMSQEETARGVRANLREASRRAAVSRPTPGTCADRRGSISAACSARSGRTRTSC